MISNSIAKARFSSQKQLSCFGSGKVLFAMVALLSFARKRRHVTGVAVWVSALMSASALSITQAMAACIGSMSGILS